MRCCATRLSRGGKGFIGADVAIQFARARYISRSSGGSAVRSAAYNGREEITAERTGELFYFRHRDAPGHHEVLLPEATPERFRLTSESASAFGRNSQQVEGVVDQAGILAAFKAAWSMGKLKTPLVGVQGDEPAVQ